MFFKGKERGNTDSGSKKLERGRTILPPKNYIQLKEYKEVKLPNLINVYRHDYSSKHFQFGTSLPTEVYEKELKKVTHQCTQTIRDLKMTEADLNWVGDEMRFQDQWPIQRQTLRIAQINVNGLSFVNDNFNIDLLLQGMMAHQVDVAAIQEINLNMRNKKVQEKMIKAMKRFDKRAGVQFSKQPRKESNDIYMPGGTAIWNSGLYAGRFKRKGQDYYGRWSYTVVLGRRQQEIMFISAYNTCKQAPEDGRTIAGQLVRAIHK
jgi:hypothetical protein